MKLAVSLLSLALCSQLYAAEASPAQIWSDARAKRMAQPGIHEEFQRIELTRLPEATRSFKERVIIDIAKGRWREAHLGYASVTVFNGDDYFSYEEGRNEYMELKQSDKAGDPLPSPHNFDTANWPDAKQVNSGDCGLPAVKHSCVVLAVPLRPDVKLRNGKRWSLLAGSATLLLDVDSGLVLGSRITRQMQQQTGSDASQSMSYTSDDSLMLKEMKYGAAPSEALFVVPDGAKKVREFKPWDAAIIAKQLKGKPAPDLSVSDISGKPLSLADFKGKTVLLDFFTTWCGPCRQDAPSLDNLYKKYGKTSLVIIGVSVSEDRSLVQDFLKSHPHDYPIVLSSENTLATPYQVQAFPTYLIIDPDGNLVSAA